MSLFHLQHVQVDGLRVSRRDFLRKVSVGAAGAGLLGFRDWMTVHAEELRKQDRALILLYMAGGPSQFETFDPKPGTTNGGPTTAIDTVVPGIQIAQHWPRVAQALGDIAVIRSMTNREGQHQRAAYQLHTGYLPSGSVKYPSLGCNLARELADRSRDLPAVVSVGPSVGAGFLGVDYEPFVVQNPGQLPQDVASAVPVPRFERRLGLLGRLEGEFAERGGEQAVADHKTLYEKTRRLVLSPEVKAFDLSDEPQALRDRYGSTQFGRGCLLARRLVEAGVTFVEVTLNGWDTHDNNFERVATLSGQADPAFAALVEDLRERGRLDRTMVVWAGEFGRTPRVNPRNGRDHYPRVFNAAVAGGGVRGGQVIGASTSDGSGVDRDAVSIADLLTTVCKSMQVDARKENLSPLGRPIKIVDGGKPVDALFG
jgi:uncharacterized protein (DUF1501 family)